jgi:hypothetical protein
MKTRLRVLSLTIVLLAAPALAQVDPVTIIDPMPDITAILGAAQMDYDPADEIALVFSDERIMIVDSSTGAVQFDSEPYGWAYVYPPGYNLKYALESYAGHNYGFDVFCDEDGDGIYCLMTLISEISVYEQQLAVICIDEIPTAAPDWSAPELPELNQNVPNPFNPSTRIDFSLPDGGRTVLRIYDARGREVRTLLSGVLPAGDHSLTWDGTDDAGRELASGTYFYQLEADGRLQTRKSLLLK